MEAEVVMASTPLYIVFMNGRRLGRQIVDYGEIFESGMSFMLHKRWVAACAFLSQGLGMTFSRRDILI